MKTKVKKEISVLQQLRDIRDKLSLEIKNMTYSQLKEYFENQETLHPPSVWHKSKDITI